MDLSIIIVSWNVRSLLERCIASIERARGNLALEVFVVDNASTDGTREWLANQESRMKNNVNDTLRDSLFVIRNSHNIGFAAANNQGIERSRGKYILLLNSDTEVQTHTFGELVQFMESHPRCGILGPKLLNSDGTLQPSVRRFPTAWSPILETLHIRPPQSSASDFDYERAQAVDQVMGACFLIRRAMAEKIGNLDEHFYIWFEEVDYCRRAKAAGWEVWYTPDVAVLHHGGQSFAHVLTARKQWMYLRSLLYYFWKHRQYGSLFVNACTIPMRLLLSTLFTH